jgi:hypothetical protein
MKKMLYTLYILNLAFCTLHSLPSFPDAEGYGGSTPGGRGGKVLFVTSLLSTGPGSLRTALQTSGPRIIVFRVSGVIRLTGKIQMDNENLSYVTVAGQTSPGGVTITSTSGTPIWQYSNCRFHNAVWRFLRFRVNQDNNGHAFEQYKSHHWIIDHCDFSGGTDETVDACYVHDITIQWSTITNSGPTGQKCGLLMAYPGTYNISIHHMLFAHHIYRGPVIHWKDNPVDNYGMIDYRNNVGHNFSSHVVRIIKAGSETRANIVGNYFIEGPSHQSAAYQPVELDPDVKVYEHDNIYKSDRLQSMRTYPECIFDTRSTTVNRTANPWNMPAVTTHSKEEAYELVLNRAGAWPRDAMNIRTVNEVRAVTGQLGKVDDLMIQDGPAPPADSDMDGMPDDWEKMMGFNPGEPSDNNGDHDGDGYTNIEEYINDRALILMGEEPFNSVENTGKNDKSKTPGLSVFPNPFTSTTIIKIRSKEARGKEAKIKIHNVTGSLCFSASLSPASSEFTWNPVQQPAGVYIIQLTYGIQKITKRLILY